MKPETFTASIEKGQDKLYISSNNTISYRNGAFVKLSTNDVFYRAESLEDLNIRRKFSIFKGEIFVKGNFTHKLFRNDLAKITFEEHEAESADFLESEIQDLKEEEFFAQGGITSSSAENLTGKYASIILEMSENKPKLKISEKGKYILPPPNPVSLMNENGKIIKANLSFDICAHASIIERDIVDVNFIGEGSILKLSYPLPHGVKEGEITVSKQQLTLDKIYHGDTLDGEVCQMTFDYSPVSGIPLLPPNSIDPQSAYNKAIEIIDQKFQDLEKRIQKLESINY